MIKNKLITIMLLSAVLSGNALADGISSKAIYDSQTKMLYLKGILVPFINELTGKVSNNKGIFDAELKEKSKLLFELNSETIKFNNMFDGEEISGYILYDHKTTSVKIPCFKATTISQFGDGFEGDAIYYKNVIMTQRHIASLMFGIENLIETDNCESSVIPELQKPSLTTTSTTTQDDAVEVEVNGKVGTAVFVNGVDSGKTIGSNGKIKVTLDTSGKAGDKSFSISLKDSAGNESESLDIVINHQKVFYKTCNDIRINEGIKIDGNYPIDPDGDGDHQAFEVYCYEMNTTEPKEFLNLVNIGEDYNYGMFKAGGARTGEDLYTHYTKVRINPYTLMTSIDRTFSKTRGAIYSNGKLTGAMASFGVASDCITQFSQQGKANVNLEGTPFYISNDVEFVKPQQANNGYKSAGSETFSENRQIVDTTGGGYCGGNLPMVNGEDGYKFVLLPNYIYNDQVNY